MSTPPLGLGIGWRPELALDIERRADLGFIEIIAENIDPERIPSAILRLRERGIHVIPHGISLSLGGAEPIDRRRVRRLADLARRLDSALVSEHVAFVRAGGIEAGHLVPLPRTSTAINVLVENVRVAQDLLPVPLALENVATMFDWPGSQMSEAEFVHQIVARTGAPLLLDVANVWANAENHGADASASLRRFPLDRVAYVHVAGGEEREGTYHDTHADAVPEGVLRLLGELCAIAPPPGVMLERDDCFPAPDDLDRELDAIASAMGKTSSETSSQR